MLPKDNRLSRKECDTLINQRAELFHTPSLFVRAVRSDNFKAAVAVSKKVSKKAVDRNKVRRAVFAALSEYTDIPAHMMFAVKKGVSDLSKEKISEEIRSLRSSVERVFS